MTTGEPAHSLPRMDEEVSQSLFAHWGPGLLFQKETSTLSSPSAYTCLEQIPVFLVFQGRKQTCIRNPALALAPFICKELKAWFGGVRLSSRTTLLFLSPALGIPFLSVVLKLPGPGSGHRQVRSLLDWQTALRHAGQGQIVTRLYGFPPPGGAGDA